MKTDTMESAIEALKRDREAVKSEITASNNNFAKQLLDNGLGDDMIKSFEVKPKKENKLLSVIKKMIRTVL